jgi:hypothetical protein
VRTGDTLLTVRDLEREAAHSSPSNVHVKYAWSYSCTAHCLLNMSFLLQNREKRNILYFNLCNSLDYVLTL